MTSSAENQRLSSGTSATFPLPIWTAGLLIIACSFLFYSDILQNGLTLDDPMVLSKNTFVQAGNKGLSDIFTHDTFYGATHKAASQLSWRYRPLSLAFFAVIHEFFGNDWSVYHLFSILLYSLSCIAVFSFLRHHVFPGRPLLALIGALAFLIHPVHTEVVANIKSADELLAFLFLIITYDRLLRWVKTSRKSDLVLAGISYVAALFSKESAAVSGAMIPVLLLVFTGEGMRSVLKRTLPFLLLTLFFIAVRLSVSQVPEPVRDLPNSPYLLASGQQKVATVLLVLGEYVRLLFYPSPLIFDYGYNHIPYVGLSDLRAVAAGIFYISLLAFGIQRTVRRRPEGFFLLAYLSGILFVSNLFFDVGPMMADRFLFTPGFFFITAFLLLVDRLSTFLLPRQPWLLPVALVLISSPFAFSKTVSRNAEWKDNRTLYTSDLKKAPGSYRVLAFNGMVTCEEAETINDSLQKSSKYREAISLFEKAFVVYPSYKMMFSNWGFAYYSLGKIDSAEWAWNRHRELNPGSQYIANNDQLISRAKYDRCMREYNLHYRDGGNYPYLRAVLREALSYRPDEPAAWIVFGKVCYLSSLQDSARYAWRQALVLDSSNAEARSLLSMVGMR